jgi:predicted molibdopterin-dependent oxidoreductase YjgC
MFKNLIDRRAEGQTVTLFIDDLQVIAQKGDSVALAVLNSGLTPFRRTPVSGAPRAPLCLMGVCFECLVDVNSKRNVQSCMVEVEPGMQVRRLKGAPSLGGGL